MDRDRFSRRLREAGIPELAADRTSPATLREAVDAALTLTEVPGAALASVHDALGRIPRDSAAAAALGTGFAAWSLAQSEAFIHHVERGADVAAFIHDNIDVLTAGWHEAAPAVAEFLVEFTLHLPEGTIHVGEQLAHVLQHSQTVENLLHMKAHAADLADAAHLLDVAEAGVTMTDVAEGLATMGLSIAAGWAAKRAVEMYYAPKIEQLTARWHSLRQKVIELVHLTDALQGGLPPAVVARQLAKVDRNRWAF